MYIQKRVKISRAAAGSSKRSVQKHQTSQRHFTKDIRDAIILCAMKLILNIEITCIHKSLINKLEATGGLITFCAKPINHLTALLLLLLLLL
jgi:hypothetical protein